MPSTGGTTGAGGAAETGGAASTTGGSIGTGGAVGTGGSTTIECVKATGSSPEIDSFEDRDGKITAVEGRSGTWAIWNDGTSWQEPSTALPSFIPNGRGGSLYAFHTFGGVFTSWGAAAGFNLDRCADVSVYTGVRFWVLANVPVTLSVFTPATVPVASGGECTDNCWGNFGFRASPNATTWTQVVAPWSGLTQPTWASAAHFDPAQVMGLQFAVDSADLTKLPQGAQFDVWIDDLEFY